MLNLAYRCRALFDSFLSVFHLEQMAVRWKYCNRSVVSCRHCLSRSKQVPFYKKLEMTPPFSRQSLNFTPLFRSSAQMRTWQRISLAIFRKAHSFTHARRSRDIDICSQKYTFLLSMISIGSQIRHFQVEFLSNV